MIFQLKLALRYLMGRKLRTVLTTLSITIGVMLIFGLNGMLPAMESAFRQGMMASANKVDLTVTSETRGAFNEGVLKTVRKTPGVAHVIGSLNRPVALPATHAPKTKNNAALPSAMLNGIDPAGILQVRPLQLEKGRLLKAGDENAVIVSGSLAQKTGLGLGDELTLPSASGMSEFQIVGIAKSGPATGTDDVFIPLKQAQKLLNQPGQINTIEALFASGSDAETVRETVLARLGDGFKLGGNEGGTEFMASLKIGELLFTMFGVMTLAMGGFIIFNTFRTVVVERRRDIGMLRAIGATRRSIIAMVLTESFLQGVIGTASGMLAGYLMISGLLYSLRPIAEQQWHVMLGGPSFTLQTYILAIGLGLVVPLLSGLYPSLSASRVSPLEAMRPSMGEITWKTSAKRAFFGAALVLLSLLGLASGQSKLSSMGAVVFLIGLILAGPALIHPISTVFGRVLSLIFSGEGHIARGNLLRQPGRAAITASAMMIGFAVLVSLVGMMTSTIQGSYNYLDKSLGTDYLLMPQSMVLGAGNVGADPKLVKELRKVPGVSDATSLRLSTTRAADVDLQVIGIDPSIYPELSGLEFSAGSPSKAYKELDDGRSLIANGIFATQSGLKAGQKITLKTPEGPKTYRVAGIGTDFLNAKLASVYISQSNLERDFHETNDILIMANQEEGFEPTKTRAAISDILRDYPAFSLFNANEWRESMKAEFTSRINIVILMMVAITLPSLLALINTLVINVLERTREIGMMRAVGATRRQVRRMIVAESLLLTTAGTAFGILAGVWLSYVMVEGINNNGFTVPYFFPYLGVLLALAVGLLFGVFGALIPARQASNMDIVTALHFE